MEITAAAKACVRLLNIQIKQIVNLQEIQDDSQAPAVDLGRVRTLALQPVDDLGSHVAGRSAEGPHGIRRGEPSQAEVAYLHHGQRLVSQAEHVLELEQISRSKSQ